MSGTGSPTPNARGLRLVSDEGRTVAEPPEPPTQTLPEPPPHPSMPDPNAHAADGESGSRNGHGSGGATDMGNGLAEFAAEILDGERRIEESRSHDDQELYAAIEAMLMVATEPVQSEVLAAIVGVPATSIQMVCNDLAREYAQAERGFALMQVAGGYQLQTAAAVAEYVERFVGSRRSARMSAAAMETLAVVAYKQPISRAQISAIRGVNADGVVRTLADQGYIVEVGRDPGPGNAALLGTTAKFLERLALDSLDDLPSLAELSVDPDAVEAMDRRAANRHC